MTTRSYEQHNCPIAQALRIVGDQWTLMIVRDALRGVCRFEGFQKSLGLSRNLLTRRLRQLEEEGLLERRPVDGSRRYEYCPTAKCRDLRVALLALAEWGERWRPDPDGPRLQVRDRNDGEAVGVRFCRLDDGAVIDSGDVEVIRRRAARAAEPDGERLMEHIENSIGSDG